MLPDKNKKEVIIKSNILIINKIIFKNLLFLKVSPPKIKLVVLFEFVILVSLYLAFPKIALDEYS